MSVYSQFNSTPTNPLAIEYITSSQVYTARASGWVNFVAVGSGGGAKGGWFMYWANNYTLTSGAGCAGAAGGLAIKSVYVQAGASYTITVGAGGTGIQHYNGFNTNARAGSGSVTSVVGPGISLVVTGGQGGGSSGNTVNPGAGGSILNTTNTTYDYYNTGGASSNGVASGGSAVGIYGNGVAANTGTGAGTGGGTGTTGNAPSNGYSNAVGRNYTRQLAGGIATTSNYCETSSLTAVNSGVLSNCGGGGVLVNAAGNTGISATGARGAVFAGGGVGSAASYTTNGEPEQYSAGTGGTGGLGGGGAVGYGYTQYYHYEGTDPGAPAYGFGGNGGAGLVIVEYL